MGAAMGHACYGSTVDSMVEEWKKLASWEYPRYSTAALFIVNFGFFYLYLTDATFLNLTMWAILIAYLSSAFAKNIWPEIRSEENSVLGTASEEEVIPESEISMMVEGTKNYYTILKNLREDSPGLFCVFASGTFILTAYFGTYIAPLPLLYLIVIGGLIFPIMIKQVKKDLPWMIAGSKTVSDLLIALLKYFWEETMIEIETRVSPFIEWVKFHGARAKERINSYKNRVGNEDNQHSKNGNESEPSAVEDVKGDEPSTSADANGITG